MAATKQGISAALAELDRINATCAEILKALEKKGSIVRDLEKRIRALEAEGDVS